MSDTSTNPTFTHVPQPQQTCPHCGYCPHCGRANPPTPRPWGTWPYQWWQYPPQVTWAVSTSTVALDSTVPLDTTTFS